MSRLLKPKRLQSILLNFGPQHPAAHGILKIGLMLSGEVILRADPQFGLLHRGSEKLSESKTVTQAIPYMDRMDYVANVIQEHSLVLAIESSINSYASTNLVLFRVIFDEFSRILNHLLTVSAVCLDMGSMGPIFWAFEEREQIMELYERVSGARMHTALYRPYSLSSNIFLGNFVKDVLFLITRGSRFISGSFLGLLNNRALKTRLSGVGYFSKKKIEHYGITGIIARSAGLRLDLRLNNSISNLYGYSSLSIRSFISKKSDSYDRFIIRAKETIESFRVINQCLALNLNLSDFKKTRFVSMEGTIADFASNTKFLKLSSGLFNGSVESPKGVVTTTLVLNGSPRPYRLSVRSPVASNLNLISTSGNSTTFADFVATFCSLDVVFGEIDR